MKRFLLAAVAGLILLPGSGSGQAQPSPPPVTGFARLAVAGTSVALSTATTGPNSATWSGGVEVLYLMNAAASAGTLYACPLGGTCTTAAGIPIAPGASYGFRKPSISMTVISDTTATAVLQW